MLVRRARAIGRIGEGQSGPEAEPMGGSRQGGEVLVGADVKCYLCGHVSGRIEADHEAPLTVSAFRPREGYRARLPRPGDRLRCERCGGPVYLEDVRPVLSYRRTATER